MKAMLYGSGDVKLYAFIGVTYPEGSTCTCTNGVVTLKAKDTGGMWAFRIPKAGEWTVTATNGERTKSETVSITAEGQFETVKLVYELMLYDAGNEYTDVTGGWSGYTSKTKTTMSLSSYYPHVYGTCETVTAKTANAIDYSDYKTLHIYVISTSYKSAKHTPSLEILSESGEQIATLDLKDTQETEVTLDVSDLATTSGIIAVVASGKTYASVGDLYSSVTFNKIWFSPE